MPISKYNNHLINFHLFSGNINQLTITHMLRAFATGLMSIFIPIFLYQIGYSILEILFFELGLFLFAIIFKSFILRFVARVGIQFGILLGFIGSLLLYLSLYSHSAIIPQIGEYKYLILLLLFTKISESLYWMAFHLDFSTNFNPEKEGKQIGILQFFAAITSMFAPLLGAIFITQFSFEFAFIIVLIILIIAMIPILFSKNIIVGKSFSYKKMLLNYSWKLNLIYFIDGMHSIAVGFLWPFYLFFLSLSLSVIGGIYTLTNFLNAVFQYYGGKTSDNTKSQSKLMNKGAFIHGLTILIRPFLESLNGILAIQSLGGISVPFYRMPELRIHFKLSRKNPLCGIANREFYLALGRFFTILIAIILVLLFSIKTAFLLCLVLIGSVIMLSFFFTKTLDNI